MDRIIEEDYNMITIIEVTSGKEILEECRIIEVRILEVDIEVTIKMKTLEEIEVDVEKDNIQVILEGMIKAAVVDQDQVQEPVLIEMGLDVSNVGSMIILISTVQTQIQKKKSQNKCNKCFNLDKDMTALKFLVADTYNDLIRTNSDDTIDHLNL